MKLKTVLTSTWKTVRKVPRTSGRLLRLSLRKLKLQILPQLTKWKGDAEEPKIAIYKHRGIALLHVFPHCIPFGAVMTLMVFNINTLFIGNVSTAAVAAFQFAAKLLELLMQASLGAILLDVIRRQIVKNQDLPFGGLLAPLRTTDVSYLWSLELWASLTSKRWRTYRKLCLGALIFAIVILAALVGPSGAVAIVPRQITYSSGRYLNVLNPPDNLFPRTVEYLDSGTAFNQGLAQINDVYGNGPFPIVDQYGTRLFGIPVDTGLPFAAATMPSRHMSYILRDQGANLDGQGDSSSTVLTMQTSQALVQAVCSENDLYDLEHNGTYLTFPESGTLLNHFITWGECLENATTDNNILFFTNLPPSAPTRHSTLMVVGTTAPTDRSYVATVSACIIDATWANVTLNATEADSYYQINYLLETHYSDGIPPSQMIDMPLAWTSRVRSAVLSSQAGLDFITNYNYPERLFAFILSNADYEYLINYGLILTPDTDCCSSVQQSNALNQYLAKIQAWSRYSSASIDTNTAWTDPATLTYQIIAQLKPGYGYNGDDITVQLSLAVLGVYCLFVVTHVCLLLLTGYTGTSWDSISELLMLGLMSRKPQHLGHVSAGVETLKTFREPVSIKVNDEGQVELVFENDTGGKVGSYGLVEVNKAY